MKNLVFVLLLVCLISIPGIAATNAYDFRETRWGMNRDEVIAAEGTPLGETANILMYLNIPFAGSAARLIYVFEDNKLVEAFYAIPAGDGDLTVRYQKIMAIMSQKYGAPPNVSDRDACIWNTLRSQVILMIYSKYDEILIAFRDRSVPIPDDISEAI